jgi:NADPH:quinone reductase-like Zn-dependent oxidoreductase
VREGQTVLVHAAAGGVGTASAGNHEYLRGLGVEPVEYGEGLADRVRALAPRGVDVALDYVGGDAVAVSAEVLAPGGVITSIADPAARTEHGGIYAWVRPSTADLEALGALADEGVLTVEVAQTFDLADAADAHRASEAGHVRGKIVVTV